MSDVQKTWEAEMWGARWYWNEEEEESDPKASFDQRSVYDRDRSRLIHTPAFRRLQTKTQVLSVGEGDYHRTRLTHTMEVAQIGRGITQHLRDRHPEYDFLPDDDLIEAISFAHDLGHPPFGHSGEVALNYMMRKSGGFEGNGQSLRQVTYLERRVGTSREHKGICLSRRTLLGFLKYPQSYSQACRTEPPQEPLNVRLVNRDDWKPPKCYLDSESRVVHWTLLPFSAEDREGFRQWKTAPTESGHGETAHKSLDCSILELADDIAYATHDLEDGVALGFIKREHWDALFDVEEYGRHDKYREFATKAQESWLRWTFEEDRLAPSLGELGDMLFGTGASRRKVVSHFIGGLIHNICLKEVAGFQHPLLRFRAELPEGFKGLLKLLQKVTKDKVVQSAELQTLEYRGRYMIMEMFEALSSDPERLLKETQRTEYENANKTDKSRVICDFIAGMTDSYASRFYERLFVPRSGSAFDKL